MAITSFRCRRRGITIIYLLVSFAVLCGLCSLGVDLGHAQLVKTELRRTCDATAHDYVELYATQGLSAAIAQGPMSYSSTYNPVDGGTVAPTVSVVAGYWNSTTNTFSTTNVTSNVAVQVTMSRTRANGNAVPILLGSLLGVNGIDVSVTSVAALVAGQSTTLPVSSLSNPYFSGMSSTVTDAAGDTYSADTPTQVSGIPVTPGQYITFTNVSGTTSVVPGTVPFVGPNGQTQSQYGSATHHNQDWNGTYPFGSASSENGIGDAVMPEDAFMGVFLGSSAPTSNTAPATVDWTQSSMLNQSDYNNIQLQEPFFIGDGSTTSNVVQKFLVPPGATRLFVGIWDGVQYDNNGGTLTATISQASHVELVQ